MTLERLGMSLNAGFSGCPAAHSPRRAPGLKPTQALRSLDSLRRLQNNFFYLANIIASAPVRSVYQTRPDGGRERERGLAQRPLVAPVLLPS